MPQTFTDNSPQRPCCKFPNPKYASIPRDVRAPLTFLIQCPAPGAGISGTVFLPRTPPSSIRTYQALRGLSATNARTFRTLASKFFPGTTPGVPTVHIAHHQPTCTALQARRFPVFHTNRTTCSTHAENRQGNPLFWRPAGFSSLRVPDPSGRVHCPSCLTVQTHWRRLANGADRTPNVHPPMASTQDT